MRLVRLLRLWLWPRLPLRLSLRLLLQLVLLILLFSPLQWL